MCSYYTLILVTVSLTISMTTQTCQEPPDGMFVIQPSDATAKEGGDVKVTCAAVVTSPGINNLLWHIDPESHRTSSTSSFTEDQLQKTSSLTIYNVSVGDHNVKCLLYYFNEFGLLDDICYFSRSAHINVQYFPKRNQLKCQPESPHPLNEGDALDVQCTVPRSNPPVDLSWELSRGEIDHSQTLVYGNGLSRVTEQSIPITKELHLQSVICRVTSEIVFPGQELECSIGPLLVFQPPHALLLPKELNLTSPDVGPIVFECDATGYPNTFNFTWICIPVDRVVGCRNSTRTNYISFTKSATEAGIENIVRIKCIATNTQGSSSSVSLVTISKTIEPYQACGESAVYSIKMQLLRELPSIDTWIAQFICLIGKRGNVQRVIKWFFDGIQISVTNASLSSSNVSLLYNLSLSDSGKEMTCEISYLNGREKDVQLQRSTCVFQPHYKATSSNTPRKYYTFSEYLNVTSRLSSPIKFVKEGLATTAIYNKLSGQAETIGLLHNSLITLSTKDIISPTVMKGRTQQKDWNRTHLLWGTSLLIMVVIIVTMGAISRLVKKRNVSLSGSNRENNHEHAPRFQDEKEDNLASVTDPVYEEPTLCSSTYYETILLDFVKQNEITTQRESGSGSCNESFSYASDSFSCPSRVSTNADENSITTTHDTYENEHDIGIYIRRLDSEQDSIPSRLCN